MSVSVKTKGCRLLVNIQHHQVHTHFCTLQPLWGAGYDKHVVVLASLGNVTHLGLSGHVQLPVSGSCGAHYLGLSPNSHFSPLSTRLFDADPFHLTSFLVFFALFFSYVVSLFLCPCRCYYQLLLPSLPLVSLPRRSLVVVVVFDKSATTAKHPAL